MSQRYNKLSKGATTDLKNAWKESIKQHSRVISNLGELSSNAIKKNKAATKIQNTYRNYLEKITVPEDLFGAAGETRQRTQYKPSTLLQNVAKYREANPDLV